MSPPADGHVHDTDDPRTHGTAHTAHAHDDARTTGTPEKP
jgi:hypothetical protein